MAKPKPVGVEELRDAILRAIVREFGRRPLDRETAVQALKLAAFELNMVEIRERAAAAKVFPNTTPKQQTAAPKDRRR